MAGNRFSHVYCKHRLRTNDNLFLQVECFLELFFSEIMLESWGCGLYTSAAYTRVFTVFFSCNNYGVKQSSVVVLTLMEITILPFKKRYSYFLNL